MLCAAAHYLARKLTVGHSIASYHIASSCIKLWHATSRDRGLTHFALSRVLHFASRTGAARAKSWSRRSAAQDRFLPCPKCHLTHELQWETNGNSVFPGVLCLTTALFSERCWEVNANSTVWLAAQGVDSRSSAGSRRRAYRIVPPASLKRMYMYVYIYIYTHMYVCVYIYIYNNMRTHMLNVYIYTYIHIIWDSMCIYIYIMGLHVYIYIYIYT